jgi:hypothetical protein
MFKCLDAINWEQTTMKARSLTIALILIAGFLIPLGCDTKSKNDKRTRIDVHQSDKAIMEELLQCTPVGSDLYKVTEFVQCCLYFEENLYRNDDGAPKMEILVKLGHIPGSFLSFTQTSVRAEWIFDADQKLSEIRITRYVEES